MCRIRKQVLNDERPPECEPCFNLEDQGVESLRQRHITGVIPEARITLYPNAISKMSEKTKTQAPQRAEVRRIVLQRDMGLCQAKFLVTYLSCSGPLDVDEVIPRGRGGDHLNPDNCQVLCRTHHRWKHDNPAEAERLGLTRSLPPKEGRQ